MLNDRQRTILNALVDKYERSKTFLETNVANQTFSIKPEAVFRGYTDDAQIKLYYDVNEAVAELERDGLVSVSRRSNGVIEKITLDTTQLTDIYSILHRVSRKDTNADLQALLQRYMGRNELLDRYCRDQMNAVSENRISVAMKDTKTYESVLKVLASAFDVDEETFQRDFSVRVLGDSKAFEKIKNRVVTILMKYGDFPDENTVFESLNILKNPGHVYFKGAGKICTGGGIMDLSLLPRDIGFSSTMLDCIDEVQVSCGKVVTIENLTTFNDFPADGAFVIYLGGFLNTARRIFIQQVYKDNPECEYYHYGDIDAGGFYILNHLKKETGVPFMPLYMDIETLQKNSSFWRPLTDNDRNRLTHLISTDYSDVISYMLHNNCKLEQEALDK